MFDASVQIYMFLNMYILAGYSAIESVVKIFGRLGERSITYALSIDYLKLDEFFLKMLLTCSTAGVINEHVLEQVL